MKNPISRDNSCNKPRKTGKMNMKLLLYDYYDRVENTVLSGKNSRIFPKKKINDWEFCENDKKNIELLTDGNYLLFKI